MKKLTFRAYDNPSTFNSCFYHQLTNLDKSFTTVKMTEYAYEKQDVIKQKRRPSLLTAGE